MSAGGGPRLMMRGRSPSPPFDVQGCVSYVNMMMIATLVISVLVGLVVWTENQKEVLEWKESVRSLSTSAERGINLTETIREAMPPINLTRVVQRSVAQDEGAWVNATINAQRTLRSIQMLVQKADESRTVERYSDLAASITRILASPKISEHIEAYSDHLIWIMNAAKSPQADSVYNVVKRSAEKVVEVVQSREAQRMVNELFTSDETRQLILETKSLVYDARQVVVTANSIIRQVHDNNVVRHVSRLLEEASEEQLLHKAAEIYDSVHSVENRFEHIINEGYEFFKGLVKQEFQAHRQEPEVRDAPKKRAPRKNK